MRSAWVGVDVAESGDATVRIEYVIAGGRAGEPVPLRLLDFGHRVEPAPQATVDGRAVRLERARGELWTGSAPLSPPDTSGEARLSIAYEVRALTPGSGVLHGVVPLLTVGLPPADPRPGLFAAELTLPPGWRVTEGFPTGLRRAGWPGGHALELQVVPAMVAFRGRAGGAGLGLPVLLDGVALGLLVAFSWVGWRHMRRETA